MATRLFPSDVEADGSSKEDILPETEVEAFRTHLLDTLLASTPPKQDHAVILRDKLAFLQELVHAKCISEAEYNSSRRPLLQRLTAQGGKIEGIEILIAGSKDNQQNSAEEWSVIDLKDEQSLMNKENSNSNKKSKSKQTMKQLKGATSVFGFGSSYKPGKHSIEKSIFDSPSLQMHSAHSKISHSKENPFWDDSEKMKRKPFRTLFQREKNKGYNSNEDNSVETEEKTEKSAKKQWGFDGLKKWKKREEDDEIAPLSLNDHLSTMAFGKGSELETKLMKNKLNSDGSTYDISMDDKVLRDKENKEVSRIQTELKSTNTNLNYSYSNNQIQEISTKLPENKGEFKTNFPKSRCDHVVLDMVKKEMELKHHVGEKEKMQNEGEKSLGWTTFEDEENIHPNLFVHQHSLCRNSSINLFSLD